jgi:hypothetical protein
MSSRSIFPLIVACSLFTPGCPAPGDTVAVSDIEAVVNEDIVTLIELSWSAEGEHQAWVEFGETDAYGHSVAPLGAEQRVTLLGMPASTEVHFQVVTENDAGQWRSEDQIAITGDLPHELPVLTATGQLDGFVAVPVMGTSWGAVIVDEQGRIVWYRISDDTRESIFSVAMSHDGSALLANSFRQDDDHDAIMWLPLDGSAPTVFDQPGARHDFAELPDGTVGMIVADQRSWEGTQATADAVIELDREGNQRVVWSFWDDFTPDVACPENDACLEDVTHANALDYDAARGLYYLTSLRMGGILAIERESGALRWVLFGFENEFELLGGTEWPGLMHQFERRDDRLLVFANGEYDEGSRVVEYALDTEAMTVEELWSYSPEPAVSVSALGDASYLGDDLIHSGWGSSGMVQQLTIEGELRWELAADFAFGFGYTSHIPSLYPPEQRR